MHELTATDELRRMLDERGVEWTEGIARPELTQVRIDGKVVKFHPWQPNTLKVSLFNITPEQAIAATLGRGMLTADDVRDLIERHSDASGGNGRDFHNGAYVAIADELNATLGSCNCSNNCTNGERTGTCHADETDRIECGGIIGGRHYDIHIMECSACGGTYEHVNSDYEFCPHCGRRVVEVDA